MSSVLFHMSNSTHNDWTGGESHSKQDAKGCNAKRLEQITFQKVNMEESSTLSFVRNSIATQCLFSEAAKFQNSPIWTDVWQAKTQKKE